MKLLQQIMKPIAYLSLILVLVGCNPVKDNNTPIEDDVDMSIGKTLNITDLTGEFDFQVEELNTYVSSDDQGISYIKVTEFISMMDEGIINLEISKANSLVLSYDVRMPGLLKSEYGSKVTFLIEFNAVRNTVFVNDLNFYDYLNEGFDFDYHTLLNILDIEINGVDPSMLIDLDDYDMDIVIDDGDYFIPLYLANLFLTGSMINVYEMGTDLFILDFKSDYQGLETLFAPDETLDLDVIAEHTEKYLTMYFDHFYGLKDYQEIDSYQTLIKSYNLTSQDSFTNFHHALEDFLSDLNDPHTSIVTIGYNEVNYLYETEFIEGSKQDKYQIARTENMCDLETEEFTLENLVYGYYVKVNGFSFETKDYLSQLSNIPKDADVIIDLTCNPGGALVGVLELLTYLTNETIEIPITNPHTGQMRTEKYNSRIDRAIDANFYILTSNASYSAANLFTSIVKDMELGTIIGQDTGGGTAAIELTVLPNGSIIVISSNTVLVNENSNLIEDGITPDIELDIPINWNNSDRLDSFYHLTNDFIVGLDKHLSLLLIDFDQTNHSESVENIKYTLTITETTSNTTLYTEDFVDDYDYTFHFLDEFSIYGVIITVEYDLNGETYVTELYKALVSKD